MACILFILKVSSNECSVIQERLKSEYILLSDTANVHNLLHSMQNGYWKDINYTEQTRAAWQPYSHLQRLMKMSFAYQNKSFSLFQNKHLLKSIINGLTYWYSNKFLSENWWYNKIGKQHCLAKIAIVFDKELPLDIKNNIINDLADSTEDFTGQNLLWMAEEIIWKGILLNDISLVQKGAKKIQAIVLVSEEEGIAPDYSFRQHGPQLYSGGEGYGEPFLRSNIQWAYCLRESSCSYPDAKIDIISDYILDGCRWMIFNQNWDFQTTGRTLVRKGTLDASVLIHYLRLFTQVDPKKKNEYIDLINHIERKNTVSVIGNKAFTWSDYVVHRRKDYFFSIKMNSARTVRTENGNSENEKGFYLTDGGTTICTSGNEYISVFPCWNWTKIPGVTSRLQSQPPVFESWGVKGNTKFSGGLSDGNIGIAAYQMNQNDIQAKKAWFMFDDEIICMVSDIKNNSQDTIVTTLNQTSINGEVWNNSSEKSNNDNIFANKIWHDKIGYVLLQKDSLCLKAEKRKGDWSTIGAYPKETYSEEKIFELTKIHSNLNKSFTYILVPGVGLEFLKKYDSSHLKILFDTPECQAVHHKKNNIWSIVSHRAQMVNMDKNLSFTINNACLLMVKKQNDKLLIYIADPTQELETIDLEINYWGKSHKSTVMLPKGSDRGKTVKFELLIK